MAQQGMGQPEVAKGRCCLCNAAAGPCQAVTDAQSVELHDACADRLLEAVRDQVAAARSKLGGRPPTRLPVAAHVVGAWRNLYRNIVRVLTDAGRLTTAHASAVASSADVLPRFHTFWTRYVAAAGGSPSSAGSPAAAPAATTDAAAATAVDTKWYADALECLCAALYVCEQPLMGKGHGDSVAVKYIHQRNSLRATSRPAAPLIRGRTSCCSTSGPCTPRRRSLPSTI